MTPILGHKIINWKSENVANNNQEDWRINLQLLVTTILSASRWDEDNKDMIFFKQHLTCCVSYFSFLSCHGIKSWGNIVIFEWNNRVGNRSLYIIYIYDIYKDICWCKIICACVYMYVILNFIECKDKYTKLFSSIWNF